MRLEIDGVLVSWAVPKGPTLDPEVKRLAVRTEDHPLEYRDFEGVIPSGEYGGGDVIVWDRGRWINHGPVAAATALAEGELHIELVGERLRGHFMLIRTNRRGAAQDQWLMFHKRDAAAVAGWDAEDHARSVLSGRTNDEIAAGVGATRDELRELAALGPKGGTWSVAGRQMKLTNLDKELAPARRGGKPITKREVIRYHVTMAPYLLPYLADRPVNLNRSPEGVGTDGFWSKAVPDYAPEWITRFDHPGARSGDTRTYFVADSVATLAWLANYGGLVELHPWTSTAADYERPSYALFDVDPGTDTTWDQVVQLARLHRTALEHLGVAGFPKVTGKRGIQIWVPIRQQYTFEETAEWVERVSRTIGNVVPDLVSWSWEKRSRKGRARLDYTQNAINKTLVAPYGVRPAAGAPVSAPISWDELDDGRLRPDRWTIRSIGDRVDDVGDLWAGIADAAQLLPDL